MTLATDLDRLVDDALQLSVETARSVRAVRALELLARAIVLQEIANLSGLSTDQAQARLAVYVAQLRADLDAMRGE